MVEVVVTILHPLVTGIFRKMWAPVSGSGPLHLPERHELAPCPGPANPREPGTEMLLIGMLIKFSAWGPQHPGPKKED